MVHSATQMTPKKARNKENELKARVKCSDESKKGENLSRVESRG